MSDMVIHSPPEKIVEGQLDDRIQAIEAVLEADVISFVGSILSGLEDVFRDEVEAIANRKDKKEKLVVILETNGGYIEVVERIAKTLRRHYDKVEFIVPNSAMSAGTVLVMSGDAIHMDYFSVLGPIDPQVRHNTKGRQVPALGYLAQYKKLIEKSDKGTLSTAELTILVEQFDQADLYGYEKAQELSVSLLEEWLTKYKFKNWSKTDNGKTVTDRLRKTQARKIASKLSDPDRWHSHGRGISMEVLRRDIGLEIKDFGENNELNYAIRVYCKLLQDYMIRLRHVAVLNRRESYVQIIQG